MKINFLLALLLIIVAISSVAQDKSTIFLSGQQAQDLYHNLLKVSKKQSNGYGSIDFNKKATVDCTVKVFDFGETYTCQIDDLNISPQ